MKTPGFFLYFLGLLFFCCALPAFAQLPDAQPDPLARIREAAKGNVQACSVTGETLCEKVAPKIIDNAQGNSPLVENVYHLTVLLAGHTADPRDDAEVAWAVAAFRAAGVEVRAEDYGRSETGLRKDLRRQNVVAEIRGREKPDEWVLLGAHLGQLDASGGAIDGASDAALVIEAARDIQLIGVRPRRSIRFVLFTGQGGAGSWAYVRAHRAELDRARAAIISKAGTDRVSGFMLNGRHDIEPGVREALKPIDSLGALENTSEAPLEIESLDFLLEGIPTLVETSPTEDGERRHHGQTVSESPEPASEWALELAPKQVKNLQRSTAIAAVTTFDIAERAAPLGTRQTRSEIESLLSLSGLEQQMKDKDLWPSWSSSERGRLP